MRILVVDDEATTRNGLRRVLEQEGHEVTLAADGGQALREIFTATERFELMLLDLRMPRMDGWDLIRLKRMSPELENTPIIVITGSDRDENAEHGGLQGVAMVFAKPIDVDKLLRTIAHFDQKTERPAKDKDET